MENMLQNNILDTILASAPKQVVSAIKGASEQVGVSFSYLVEQAKAESSFDAAAEAATSSATGLYQFIESTWMNMVEKHGDKYGIETEGKSRDEILDLRKDAEISCYMAAEFANENKDYLERTWAQGDKDIGSTELYFAHFMGAGGASAFLNARDDNPLQEAALLFPKAAAANRNVFYEPATGRARSLEEVYNFFDKKFSGSDVSGTQLAQASDEITIKPDNASTPGALGREAKADSVLFKRYPTHSSALPLQSLVSNPVEVLMMAQMDLPFTGKEDTGFSWF